MSANKPGVPVTEQEAHSEPDFFRSAEFARHASITRSQPTGAAAAGPSFLQEPLLKATSGGRRDSEIERHDAEVVDEALEQKALDQKARSAHPLRRFNTKLSVAIIYSSLKKTQRKMVVMVDSIKWTSFADWACLVLGLNPPKSLKHPLQFSFRDLVGRSHPIYNQASLTAWLDTVWMEHPPKLYVSTSDVLITQGLEHAERIRQIFESYDIDGSGWLDPSEVKTMILEMNLHELGVSREEISHYLSAQFRLADTNADQRISFEEFGAYYNSLKDYLKDKLTMESKYAHMRTRYAEEFVEARSPHLSFQSLAARGGLLKLDLHDQDFGIAITLRPQSSSAQPTWRMRAETVMARQVDYFLDATGECGSVCSPAVCIEIDRGHDGAESQPTLDHPYELIMPHCAGSLSNSGDPLCKADLIVTYSTWEAATWVEVTPDAYHLLPPAPMTAYGEGAEMPRLSLDVDTGGLFCVFLRRDRRVPQRVQCLAFAASPLLPLALHAISVYIVPHLPDEIEACKVREQQERGKVDLVGRSEVFELAPMGRRLEMTLRQSSGDKESLVYDGEAARVQLNFDAGEFIGLAGTEGGSATQVGEFAYEGTVPIEIAISDLRWSMVAPRRSAAVLERIRLSAALSVREFPPPSPPQLLRLCTHTNLTLSFDWATPAWWGGCALSHYEYAVRGVSHKGQPQEWSVTETVKTFASVSINTKHAEVRVRAYTVGSRAPSDWCAVLVVRAMSDSEREGHNVARKSQDAEREKVQDGTTAEGGVAVVVHDDLEDFYRKKHEQVEVGYMNQAGWSPLCKACGRVMLEIGVQKGVAGRLFDVTPTLVEKLVTVAGCARSDEYVAVHALDKQRPLLSFATVAVWVLQTLAHHTDNAGEWIETMHDIAGMMELAASCPEEAGSEPMLVAILSALHEIYECMRQCEPGGFVTAQLQHKYDKSLRQALKTEWKQHLCRLKHAVAIHVMGLKLYERSKGRGANATAASP